MLCTAVTAPSPCAAAVARSNSVAANCLEKHQGGTATPWHCSRAQPANLKLQQLPAAAGCAAIPCSGCSLTLSVLLFVPLQVRRCPQLPVMCMSTMHWAQSTRTANPSQQHTTSAQQHSGVPEEPCSKPGPEVHKQLCLDWHCLPLVKRYSKRYEWCVSLHHWMGTGAKCLRLPSCECVQGPCSTGAQQHVQ
jgi:hypothetical protein